MLSDLRQAPQGWAYTEYQGGRNKLAGSKKGTRAWKAYFVCTCPKGKHKPVPEGWEYCMGPDGNPRAEVTFPTECPLNARQLKMRLSHDRSEWKLFSKWTKTTRAYVSNHGDTADLARRFMVVQGAGPAEGLQYCHNAGRLATAGWLCDLHVPYHESVQITGDLWDVWKKYQPSLLASDFAERRQDPVARNACAALRRMVHSMGRGHRPSESEIGKRLSLQEKLMMSFMTSQGQGELARNVTERHHQEEDEGKMQD